LGPDDAAELIDNVISREFFLELAEGYWQMGYDNIIDDFYSRLSISAEALVTLKAVVMRRNNMNTSGLLVDSDAVYDEEGKGTLKDFIVDEGDIPEGEGSGDETDANHTAEQDETGKTALMLAAQSGAVAIAKLLLQQQVDENLQDDDGNTALMYASSFPPSFPILQMLLNKNVFRNMQNEEGNTALHWAALNKQCQAMRALLRAKADHTIKNDQGFTCCWLNLWGKYIALLRSAKPLFANCLFWPIRRIRRSQ
jgi:hypothetical protein